MAEAVPFRDLCSLFANFSEEPKPAKRREQLDRFIAHWRKGNRGPDVRLGMGRG